ncbi:unnamed protein product, partial [Ectocarpus sp. 8 AP-2014]
MHPCLKLPRTLPEIHTAKAKSSVCFDEPILAQKRQAELCCVFHVPNKSITTTVFHSPLITCATQTRYNARSNCGGGPVWHHLPPRRSHMRNPLKHTPKTLPRSHAPTSSAHTFPAQRTLNSAQRSTQFSTPSPAGRKGL